MNEAQRDPDVSAQHQLVMEVLSLRRQVSALLVGIVVASLTLTAFLTLESHRTSIDLELVRNMSRQKKPQYEEINKSLNTFLGALNEYGKSHPEFAAILTKHRIKVHTTTNAPASTPPAPAKK